MPIQPRPEINDVPSVSHGGFMHEQAATPLLDFSANINPFGPTPHIWAAMQAVDLGQHPDPRATPLRTFLAEIEGVDSQQLLVGNGSVDLIYHLAVAYLRVGDHVVIVEPTFGEYAAAATVMGATVHTFRTHPETDFDVDIAALIDVVRNVQPRLLFLCNPNNPTGTYLAYEIVEQLVSSCPETLVVLDEAFMRFIAAPWPARELLTYNNLLILRSLTKDYALTGLRVGYALASTEIITALTKVQPPWSVNALAQVTAIAALNDEHHLRTSLAALKRAKDALVDDLKQIRMYPMPSQVHFFLLPVPSATEWARQLRERGILVRDCTSFGLPTFVRIAARHAQENDQLVAALAEIGGRVCKAAS